MSDKPRSRSRLGATSSLNVAENPTTSPSRSPNSNHKKRRALDDSEFEDAQPANKRNASLASADLSKSTTLSSITSQLIVPSKNAKKSTSSSSSKPIVIDLDESDLMDFSDADDWVNSSSTKSFGDHTASSISRSHLDTQSQSQLHATPPQTLSNHSFSLRPSTALSPSQPSPSMRMDSQSTLLSSRQDEKKRSTAKKAKSSSATPSIQMSSYLHSSSPTSTPSQPTQPSQDISATASSLPWCDKHTPKSLDQLAMHATKLTALVDTLASMIRSCQLNRSHQFSQTIPGVRVLVLTGPTGTGKSTAVKLLLGQGLINERLPLERFDIELLEYHNPVQYTNQSLDEVDALNDAHLKPSSSTWSSAYESKLKPFLQQLQTQKYPALSIAGIDPMGISTLQISDPPISSTPLNASQPSQSKIKVLLVEDMPYLHDWRQKTDFQSAIKGILNSRDYNPVIFVLSHAQSTDTSTPWQLFTREILEHPSVKLLEFNPVNSLLIKKALSAILKEERLSLSKEELGSLVETCSGDIRSAVNSLQWIAERNMGVRKPATTSSRAAAKATAINADLPQTEIMKKSSRGHSGEAEYVKVKVFSSLSRDVSLSLFHSLGKILYVKRLHEGDVDDAGNVVSEMRDDRIIPPGSPLYRLPMKASPESIHASNVAHEHAGAGGLLLHYMHENYLKFFGDMEDALSAAEYLAAADLFSAGPFREQATLSEYADLVAMRGIMFSNAHPRERTFTGLIKPQSLQAMRTKRDNIEIMDLIYTTPNLEFNLTKQQEVRFARVRSSEKNPGIITEILGRGELLPHQTSFLSRTSIACEVMPYYGTIWREASRNRMSGKYTGVLRPAERSFVETMCRFSLPTGVGSNAFATPMRSAMLGSSVTLNETGSAEDTEDYESSVKERDRKHIIVNNILQERRAPLQLGTMSPFNSGTSAISSSVYRRPNAAYSSSSSSSNASQPQFAKVSSSSAAVAPSSSSPSTFNARATTIPSNPLPAMSSTRMPGPGGVGIRIGRIGQPSLPHSQPIQVIDLDDDIVDDEAWSTQK